MTHGRVSVHAVNFWVSILPSAKRGLALEETIVVLYSCFYLFLMFCISKIMLFQHPVNRLQLQVFCKCLPQMYEWMFFFLSCDLYYHTTYLLSSILQIIFYFLESVMILVARIHAILLIPNHLYVSMQNAGWGQQIHGRSKWESAEAKWLTKVTHPLRW